MAENDPRKLLRKAGPTVTCDLCPSFTLIITDDDTLDIRLHTASNGKEWYFADEELRAAFSARFTEAVGKLPHIEELTVTDIDRFKQVISQMLIQEVKDQSLFRGGPGLDEDDEEDEEDDGGEEHA